jgi:hypothetical protein
MKGCHAATFAGLGGRPSEQAVENSSNQFVSADGYHDGPKQTSVQRMGMILVSGRGHGVMFERNLVGECRDESSNAVHDFVCVREGFEFDGLALAFVVSVR